MIPWDFTIYMCANGDYIIKVMFSEGQYKFDVARFFCFNKNEISSLLDMNEIEIISEKIRSDYENYKVKELTKEQFDNLA